MPHHRSLAQYLVVVRALFRAVRCSVVRLASLRRNNKQPDHQSSDRLALALHSNHQMRHPRRRLLVEASHKPHQMRLHLVQQPEHLDHRYVEFHSLCILIFVHFDLLFFFIHYYSFFNKFAQTQNTTAFGSPQQQQQQQPNAGFGLGAIQASANPTFGSTATFGAGPTFGSPKGGFGTFSSMNANANANTSFTSPQKNSLFESLGSSENTMTFGNLAQNQNPAAPKQFSGG